MGFTNSQHMITTKGKTLTQVTYSVCIFLNTLVQGFRFQTSSYLSIGNYLYELYDIYWHHKKFFLLYLR